jgi:prepilin-type N-terminal cleavage/methylation domain-containing protein
MPTANRQPVTRPAGFTLVELMVSVALVLIIILGVNAVFKMASDTINTGMALSSADRDNRAIQSVLYNDFQTSVLMDAPMFLIRSERVPAFRNSADESGDPDGDPLTIDLDNNNDEGEPNVLGEVTTPSIYNSRNHRIDRVNFFASHLFRRQTGNAGSGTNEFIGEATSNEAYLSIGHLRQPDFGTPLTGSPGRFTHRTPNDPSVPKDRKINNYYATDWILGRSVTLLRDWTTDRDRIAALSGQSYVENDPFTIGNPNLTPLSPASVVRTVGASANRDRFAWSTCDLANATIGGFREKVSLHFQLWSQRRNFDPWWVVLGSERFEGYPYPSRPLTPDGYSRTVPVFVRGCTQFIVEYAGDYLAQNPETGDVVGTYLNGPTGVDGAVDYLIVTDGNIRSRRIRWYGMPRNVDLSDDNAGPMIRGVAGGGGGEPNNMLVDVVPLRDVLTAAGANVPTDQALFHEKFEPINSFTMKANYAAPGTAGLPADARYYAAWGPSELAKGSLTRPRMIRITLTVDDPNGRITEGQTYEYVIDLP